MWPTHIVGAFCEVCDSPYTVAWRETEGRKYRKRMDVEVLVSCRCDGIEPTQPQYVEPEVDK